MAVMLDAKGESDIAASQANFKQLLDDEFAAIHIHPAGELVLARLLRSDLNRNGSVLRQMCALTEIRQHDLLAAGRRLTAREVQAQ